MVAISDAPLMDVAELDMSSARPSGEGEEGVETEVGGGEKGGEDGGGEKGGEDERGEKGLAG